jgi:hypothetical protein
MTPRTCSDLLVFDQLLGDPTEKYITCRVQLLEQ